MGTPSAGAINIVLRRGAEGVEASTFAARPTDAGGGMEQGSALWGGEVGQGHMTVAVDVFRRQEIPDAAREHSRAQWTPGGTFADASGVSGGRQTPSSSRPRAMTRTVMSPPSTFPALPVGRSRAPSAIAPAACTPARSPTHSAVRAQVAASPYADISWGMARYGRERLFLALDHPLGEGADAYLDIRAARDKTLERYAPSVGTFSVTSETLRDQLLSDPEIDSLPESVRVSHRFVGHGNREWLTTLEEYDVTLGLEGQFADSIGYEAHLRYYRHDSLVDGNTFVSGKRHPAGHRRRAL